MFNRRKFLQLGATSIGALTLARHTFAHTINADSNVVPFYKVVYDERLQDCLNFAKEVEKTGAVTHGTRGDIASLWYQDIKPALQKAPGIVAGLTQESTALYISALGRDIEHYQVFRGDHYLTNDNIVGHQVSAPDYMIEQARNLDNSGNHWGADVARLLSQYQPGAKQTGSTVLPFSPVNDVDDNSERLVSWIIAPIYN